MEEFEKILYDEICKNNISKLNIKKVYSEDFYNLIISYFGNHIVSNKYLYVKRFLDICLSILLIFICAIPCTIIAMIIYLCYGKPIIFRSKRIGMNGESFVCYKFRTMLNTAKSDVPTNQFNNKEQVTKFGRFLRKNSFDELPQLINVLKGNMSLIGYRPLIEEEFKCNALRQDCGILKYKPGITGFAQINGRDNVYYKNKVLLDAYYLKNLSFINDLKILLFTIMVVVSKEGNNDSNCDSSIAK